MRREAWEELGVRLHLSELSPLDEIQVKLRDMHCTLHPFAWPYSSDLSELVLGEGAGMKWVTPAEMLTRVEAGAPDKAVCEAMTGLPG